MNKTTISLNLDGKTHKIEARECNSFLSSFWGKMFSFSREPILLVLDKEETAGIHMLFVFQRLLVIWLDANQNPVAVKEMKPFVSYHRARAKYVLEVPLANL
jgi:uncharacterized membrane protein (UPF0127 family)